MGETNDNFLTREAAAARVRERGITTVTATTLGKLASQGRGPPYSKMGRHAFYLPTDVDAWVAAEMRPVMRGRQEAKGA